MMSLWDALRMNMMISYQELVRTFLSCFGKNISHRFSSSTSTIRNQQHKKEHTMPPHKIRQEWLALDETAEVILQHSITLQSADLIRHSFIWRNRSICL
ncbi:hypothetical protein OSK38_23015, partial [Escherichia coli]|nr:hypothetical protein [Escherichia coli]